MYVGRGVYVAWPLATAAAVPTVVAVPVDPAVPVAAAGVLGVLVPPEETEDPAPAAPVGVEGAGWVAAVPAAVLPVAVVPAAGGPVGLAPADPVGPAVAEPAIVAGVLDTLVCVV